METASESQGTLRHVTSKSSGIYPRNIWSVWGPHMGCWGPGVLGLKTYPWR